jgi:hypothetical protein
METIPVKGVTSGGFVDTLSDSWIGLHADRRAEE